MNSEDWEPAKLQDLIEIAHGFAFKGEFFTKEPTHHVLVTPGNFEIGGGFKSEKLKYYEGPIPEAYILSSGEIIVTMTDLSKAADTLGYSAKVPPSDNGVTYLHNQRIGRVSVKDEKRIDLNFVNWILRSHEYRDFVVGGATGTTVKHTSPTRILNYEFKLPSPDEQRAIAKMLGDLDDKIDLLREMNRTLEDITRAVFRAWFVDFEPVRAKAAGATTFGGIPQDLFDTLPDSFETSEVGKIPTGWTVDALSELVSQPIKRGLAPKYISEGGVAVLNQKCVRSWEVNFELERRHDETVKPLKDKTVKLLDILVNSTGVGTLGRVAQVYELRETTTVDSHLSLVRPNPERITPILLGIDLTEREAEIERLGHGSTGQTELSRQKLGELPVIVPPTNMQRAFDGMMTPSIERKTSNSNEIATLAALRDTLLPKLISGELKAPSLDALGLEGGD